MIKIKNPRELEKYFNIPKGVVSFLENADENTENKKYEFGEYCFINVQSCDTKTETLLMEAHNKNVDIQYLIRGEEKIYYTNKNGLTVKKPCREGGDTTLYEFDENSESVTYTSGEAIVLYTDEAHLPNRAPGEPTTIKKAVVKLNACLSK